jgi:hypothetical protein
VGEEVYPERRRKEKDQPRAESTLGKQRCKGPSNQQDETQAHDVCCHSQETQHRAEGSLGKGEDSAE